MVSKALASEVLNTMSWSTVLWSIKALPEDLNLKLFSANILEALPTVKFPVEATFWDPKSGHSI